MEIYFKPPLIDILAIRKGILFIATQSHPNLIVESDGLQVVNLLNEEETEPSSVDCWLEVIITL